MPGLLIIDHKCSRVTTLALFDRNYEEFFHRYVTVDGTWIYYNIPEVKREVSLNESAPKKAMAGLSANKTTVL